MNTSHREESDREIVIGDHVFSYVEFREIVIQGFSKSDLIPNDPRIKLLEEIKSLRVFETNQDGTNRTFLCLCTKNGGGGPS